MLIVARALMLATLISPFALTHAQTPAERGLEIAKEADRRDTGWGDSTADVTMTLRTASGGEAVRELNIESFENPQDGDKSLVRFNTPQDIRGTALLTFTYKDKPDDQWLYLPVIKKVKRIATKNQMGPFMGSEFAFEDMAAQEVDKFTYRYLREETCPSLEGKCFVVERKPTAKYSGYSYQVVWVDQTHYRIDKIDYFDRKESLLKTLENKGFKQYLDRFWRPSESLMTNHQTGKSTLLISSNIAFKQGLSENRFTSSRLGR